MESPSVSKASISIFNCCVDVLAIIPSPEVPPTKKLVTLFSSVPGVNVSVGVVSCVPAIPLRILPSSVPELGLFCAIPSLDPSFLSNVGDTSTINASIKI